MKALYNLGKLGFITGLIVGTVYFPTLSYGQSVAEQRICQQKGNYAAFARQPILGGQSGQSGSPADNLNVQRAHEQIFFCSNGRIVDNIGFGVGKSDIAGVPISGTGVRFSYSPREISNGRAADGSRIDAFVLIDNRRYDTNIIKQVLGFMPDLCELQNDGRYSGIGNNCQSFTENVRREYWKRIFVGTWEAQISNNRYQMRVTWNSATTRYEGTLVQQGQVSQEVRFSIGELCWTATLAGDLSRMNEKQKWRYTRNGKPAGSEWRDGIVDLDRSTVDNLISSTHFRRVSK